LGSLNHVDVIVDESSLDYCRVSMPYPLWIRKPYLMKLNHFVGIAQWIVDTAYFSCGWSLDEICNCSEFVLNSFS